MTPKPDTADALRPFRFSAGAPWKVESRDDLVAHLRFLESAGYATASFPDHQFMPMSPIVAMAVASQVSDRLRFMPFVLANDLRNPVMLAKDLATLDVFSGGRIEAGVGAGWMAADYASTGIEFHPPGVRLERLAESIEILRHAWSGKAFAYSGKHFRLGEATGLPFPIQPGGPPILVGGGMRKVLTLAGQHADIVSMTTQAVGTTVGVGLSARDRLAERVGWVREAAAERATQPELHILLSAVAIAADRRAGARACAEAQARLTARFGGATSSLDEDDILASPFFAVGSVADIEEQLQALREEFGISYFGVMEPSAREFAPVVEALAGR